MIFETALILIKFQQYLAWMDQQIIHKNHGDNFFDYLANTFNLRVDEIDNTLIVELDDFTDWTKYKKQYILNQSHNDIHKKVELTDIYTSLKAPYLSHPQGDLTEYKFDQIMKDVNGYECFRIEKCGRVCVFCVLFDRNGSKNVVESVLKLQLNRKMNQQEISAEKIRINANLKKQSSEQLIKRICMLQLENARLITANQQLTQKHEENTQKISQLLNFAKFQQITQSNNEHFKVDDCKVVLKKGEESYVHYIFSQMPIFKNSAVEFSIKVMRISEKKRLMIGIVDYNEQKNKKIFETSHFCLSATGVLYFKKQSPEGSNKISTKKTYVNKDTVKVEVNRKTKVISFYIKNDLVISHPCQILGDSSKIFVPFVQMLDANDEVLWVEEAKK